MKLVSSGYTDSRCIVDNFGTKIAMCERYTLGKEYLWAVHELKTGKKICEPVHSTARKAMLWLLLTRS